MWKFIKQAWLVMVDRAQTRMAVRILTKQKWSFEFLVFLLCKTRDLSRQECYLTLKNEGQEIIVHAGAPEQNPFIKKENDLNVLEQNVALEAMKDAAEALGII